MEFNLDSVPELAEIMICVQFSVDSLLSVLGLHTFTYADGKWDFNSANAISCILIIGVMHLKRTKLAH